ncbi:MAG: hypothetical protein WB390_10975 [Pseudolabrys sp.]
MTPFEPDGVYNSIPYRVLPDCSIEAMMPGGLVKFKNMDQLVATSKSAAADNGAHSQLVGRSADIPAPARPHDYYSILLEAINATKQNSAQLRALVYERARFNLKRDVLFGYSSMGLADVVRQIDEFERAVVRIEANAVDDPPHLPHREQAYRDHDEPADIAHETDAKPGTTVQVLPPEPVAPLYAGLTPNQRADNFHLARLAEEFVRHVRFANKSIGVALLGIAILAIIGTVFVTVLWPSHKVSSPIAVANKLPQTGVTAAHDGANEETPAPTDNSPKVAFPLPNSFGIYVLSDNKLTELEPLPISIPDARIALSAEIDKPSATTISDERPAFILFRRDLLNNVPQKIMLRVIAHMARETKIVGGKAGTTNIDGAWRIRNISRELKISPIPGQREMVIARLDGDVPLATGRYALVLNRTGYDFAVKGTVQSPEFCLEKFETASGSLFNQCRTP